MEPTDVEPSPVSKTPLGSQDSDDAADLQSFGYTQQLQRSMGGFSSFAIAFSLISITTGIFANFGTGLRSAGPAVLWSWTIAVVGQLLVALVLADLAARFPLSGYGYQWTSRLRSPHFGFFVGWLLLLQFLTGFPGICSAFAETLSASWPGERPPLSVPWITVLVMSVVAIVHLFGIRLVSWVNDAGVVTEIVGSIVIIALLLIFFQSSRAEGLSFLFDRTTHLGAPAGLRDFAASLLVGAWCLTGFEAAADLAEETHQPRKTIPRAILTSEISSGVGGFLMLTAFLLAIDDLPAVQHSDAPLPMILDAKLGGKAAPWILFVVLTSIFACGMASMAAATRLIFAMARDRMLPISGALGRVHPEHQTPRNAILLVWLLSCFVVLGLERLKLITSIAVVTGYLGYFGILWASLRGSAPKQSAVGFSLGRWRGWVGGAALTWTMLAVVALIWPDNEDAHVALVASLVGIGFGAAVYWGGVRHRILTGAAGPPTTKSTISGTH